MKRKMVIIRFGSSKPLKKEVAIVTELTSGLNDPALAVSLAGIGLVSFAYTDTKPDEIVNIYRGIAEATDDRLPVIAFELGKAGVHLEDLAAYNKAREEFERRCAEWEHLNQVPVKEEAKPVETLRRCELGLDELLDIVSQRGGVSHLTQPELARLEELSKK